MRKPRIFSRYSHEKIIQLVQEVELKKEIAVRYFRF